jgi:hypothetical protein
MADLPMYCATQELKLENTIGIGIGGAIEEGEYTCPE